VIVHLDGQWLEQDAAVISVRDRGFLFGDGVFETALLHQGGFLRLRQHLDRFAASAAMLRLPHPPLDEIARIVHRLALLNGMTAGNVRVTLSRGVLRPALLVTITPPDAAWQDRARSGWRIITARTRRPSTAAVPAQLKALGRTYSILARHEAADAGVDDALLLTDHGIVCEGPAWNVFWRTGSTLFTPHLDAGVLAGVTRSILLDIAADAGLHARTGLFPRSDLDSADEIFASMTSVGIVSIRQLDGRSLPADTPAADALQPLYWSRVEAETAAEPVT
jgi:branched-chain amino acid aminotransferase